MSFVLVLVVVLVLENRSKFVRCVIAHGLEGSRFGTHPAALANFVSRLIPLDRVKGGGSRERLNALFCLKVLLWNS